MTIKTLVYRLWRRLEGSNIPDDTRYTYRELRSYVVGGIGYALKAAYLEQRNLEDFKYGDEDVSYTYLANVIEDPIKGLQYVNLTGQTISMAGNRFIDINSSNSVSGLATTYVPLRESEVFLIKLQPKTPCMNYFYKEDGKAYFFGKKIKETQVRVTERYSIPNDDDKELNLPVELENLAFDEAYKRLVPVMPTDRQNDGTPLN